MCVPRATHMNVKLKVTGQTISVNQFLILISSATIEVTAQIIL